MSNNKLIGVVLGIFLLVGIMAAVLLPKETKKNGDASIRIGAGDDISGVLMKEIVEGLEGKYKVSDSMESTSFKDCCSNTAQWALNAKEINIGFYCPHIAKHTVEYNDDVEIYGPVSMNSELIVYKDDWENATKLGVNQGREQLKNLSCKTYPQFTEVDEITEKGILYAMEDGQVDAAVMDITKAAGIKDYPNKQVSDHDYISYVLVVDKEFEQTEAFADFIESYNQAVDKLNDTDYLSKKLGVDSQWLSDKNIQFLKL